MLVYVGISCTTSVARDFSEIKWTSWHQRSRFLHSN